MDNDEMAMCTLYNAEGKRIGMHIQANLEDATHRGKEEAKMFGTGHTYKVWRIIEEKNVETSNHPANSVSE